MISALADGQLQGAAFARAVEAAHGDAAAREAWRDYHLIGDVLRSGELASHRAPGEFMARLQARLRDEPGFAPVAAPAAKPIVVARALPAANDGSMRWKMVAGVASVAAVAAFTWNVAVPPAAQPQLAAAPASAAPVAKVVPAGVMIRDAHIDQLLAAHRQLGGATALQAPAGFLRNATFEGPAR
ncbi:sigma-E factor negative regulatory protein [Ramlibacter sp.]|uniref:sigma-E factor negative regulatory protein n=1 Tax=Ramlibacter sp. TaxID=1917967 RepID=UPI003D13DB61